MAYFVLKLQERHERVVDVMLICVKGDRPFGHEYDGFGTKLQSVGGSSLTFEPTAIDQVLKDRHCIQSTFRAAVYILD